VIVLAALVFVLWPVPFAHDTGSWMAQAGVEPRYETIDGLRLRYVRKGEGPPVLLLHGISSSLYTWKDVLPALAAHHDVIAVDLPGFGDSAIPSPASGDRIARSVVGLMDRLGITRASIVGNSLGGAIAIAIAARLPDRVDRIVLIDAAGYNFAPADRPFLLRLAGNSLGGALSVVTAARWPERVDRLVLLDAAGYNLAMERRPWLLRVFGRAGGLLDLLPQRPIMRLGLRQVFSDDSRVTDERVEEYLGPMGRPGARAASRRLLAGAGGFGLPGLVRQVKAPTLVIWGANDAWIPPADADQFVRDIPGARKVVLPSCGHVPQEERPEEVARLILEFLEGK